MKKLKGSTKLLKYRNILFTDEKIFTIEEHIDKQNDRVYVHNPKESFQKPKGPSPYPALVTVWWEVSYYGATKLHSCERSSFKVY